MVVFNHEKGGFNQNKSTNEYRMWDDVGIEDGMLSLLQESYGKTTRVLVLCDYLSTGKIQTCKENIEKSQANMRLGLQQSPTAFLLEP